MRAMVQVKLWAAALVLASSALLAAAQAGPGGPGPAVPPTAPQAPLPPCECPLPADGGGYFGNGKQYVSWGCSCANACEFRPGPTGPKPSCATLCTCPKGVSLQTFNLRRGPLVAAFNSRFSHPGRKLFQNVGKDVIVTY